MFAGCPSVCGSFGHTDSPWIHLYVQEFINSLEEFNQIYNFGAVGDKEELIRLCSHRS